MNQGIPVIMCKVVELAELMGVSKLNALDGCWEVVLDEDRGVWFAANGHREPTKAGRAQIEVPPFSVYFEGNGWPLGIVNPHGGITGMESEDFIIEQLDAAIAKAKGPTT